MDTRFQFDHSELSFSITRFSNNDDARARVSTPYGLIGLIDYVIRNKGWELDGAWKGGRGDFRFAVGGNLTFYSSSVVPEDKGMSMDGFPTVSAGIHGRVGWKQWALILSGHGHGGNSILCDSFFNSALFKYYLENYPEDIRAENRFSGRFFRVDQVRLQYELRSHLRLYASLDNFFLFTSYPGSDPEMALHGTGFGFETASFPTSRRILTGLEITF